MDKFYNKFKGFLLDLFFPKSCLGCQKEGSYLCDDCRALLDIAEFDYCLCNTKPIRLPLSPGHPMDHTPKTGKCSKCQDKRLSGIYSALPYKETGAPGVLTRKLIYQFKYQPYLKDLAKTLANILVEHFVLSGKNTDEIWGNSILIPVPLNKRRLKNRGYNQSEELAKELSKILQIPVITNSLLKIKPTKSQMELSKKEREVNLRDAFIIKNPTEFVGKKVFLVDDVYTTGSTMQECATVLRNSGAKQVWGIALAREE